MKGYIDKHYCYHDLEGIAYCSSKCLAAEVYETSAPLMYMHDILAVGTAMFHILAAITTERDQAEWPYSKKNRMEA